MPSSDTFSVRPIGEFVKKWVVGGLVAVDPFARNSKIARPYTNDLNPETEAEYHLQATDFLEKLKNDGVVADIAIFDPPYSPRQISECYKRVGLKCGSEDTRSATLYRNVRDRIDAILKPNGVVLSFGWNTVGMGVKRGYEIEEILLVCHGGAHNDTICMAERKVGTGLEWKNDEE